VHVRSGKVAVRIGEPIPTTGMDLAARLELTQRLYQEIAAMLERPVA
jgi:hypothetical protein